MVEISYPKNIQIFFNEVVHLIKENLSPDYILLAGSFAKESWLYNGEKLISDFEIVFVCSKKWSVSRKEQLIEELNKKYSFKIELKGYLRHKIERKILSNYALQNPGYINLNFFDTFNEPKYLYGKTDLLLNISTSVDELPVWEAWRLYANRMGDLLSLLAKDEVPNYLEKYYWLKIFESTADAYFIIHKIYNKNILKRLEIFHKKLLDNDIELSDICKKSFPIIQKALQTRKEHDLSIFNIEQPLSERKLIIISWMEYFEKKMGKQENILFENKIDFNSKYIENRSLQKRHIDLTNDFNIFLTNALKLTRNINLLGSLVNFSIFKYSWRHIILLSISSTFYEQTIENHDFLESKKIFGKIINRKKIDVLNNLEFIQSLISYWKIIR